MGVERDYWNNEAKNWIRPSEGSIPMEIRESLLEEVEKYLIPGGLTLNLGSGNEGYVFSKWNGKNIINFDLAEKMLQTNMGVVRVQGDARDHLPFADKSFVNIYSSFLMRYLSAKERRQLISEISRVLVKGGRAFIIDVPDNGHQLQVAKFDAKKMARESKWKGLKVLVSEEREMSYRQYQSLGFGSYEVKLKGDVGILCVEKHK